MTSSENKEIETVEPEKVINEILDQVVDALLERNISQVEICAGLVAYGSAMSLELAPSTELAYTLILSSLLDQTKQKLATTPIEEDKEFQGQNAPSTQTMQ